MIFSDWPEADQQQVLPGGGTTNVIGAATCIVFPRPAAAIYATNPSVDSYRSTIFTYRTIVGGISAT